jgi:hypothetical protein
MARSRTLATARRDAPVAVVNANGEKSIAGEYYEKHVTSGNKWGFPLEKPKPPYTPLPPKVEPEYVPEPWWRPLCDWRWLLAVRGQLPRRGVQSNRPRCSHQHPSFLGPSPQLLALLALILLLLAMPERPPPACPVADCAGVLGGKAGVQTQDSCSRPRDTADALLLPSLAVMDACGMCNGFNKDMGCDVRISNVQRGLKLPHGPDPRVPALQGVCFSGAVRDTFGGCCKAAERGCNGQCYSSPCSCSAPQPAAAQQCRPPPQQAAPQQCGAGVQRSVVQGRHQSASRWYSG